MLVNEKPFRRVNTSDKTLGWPVSTTESFFMDGERQEQEGWDLAKLQASEPDPERMFTSFDRVPRNRWPLAVVGLLALVLVAAVASARIPAARDMRRRTIAAVSAKLPPMHWRPVQIQAPSVGAPMAVAATTPAQPEAVAPVAAPGPAALAASAPVAPAPSVAPATPAPAPVAAPAAIPAAAPVVAAAPVPRATTVKPAPLAVSLLPWKAVPDTSGADADRRASNKPANPTAATPRRRPAAAASSSHHGMVWSPQAMTLVPATPADSAPEIIPPSNTDSAAAAAPSAPTPRSTFNMSSHAAIEPPALQAAPAERPAPSTEPAPFKGDEKEKAPIIE